MKTIPVFPAHKGEFPAMKKIMLVVLLATALVFAFAASAFALSPAYTTWTAGGVNATSQPTPHKDYQLTTEKCAVCHSVHAAGWFKGTDINTATIGDFDSVNKKGSQLLLRGAVSDACSYCHISTAIGGAQIYGGSVTNWTTDTAGYGHSSHAACTGCHSVHGAATINGDVAPKILKSGATNVAVDGRLYQAEFTTDKGAIDALVGNRNTQITGFCTKCHAAYSNASEQTVTMSGYFKDSSGTIIGGPKTIHNHPLVVAGATFSGASHAGATTVTGPVAFVDATACRSCHAAGLDGSTTNLGILPSDFPHSTPGNGSFLTAATDSGAAVVGVDAAATGSDGVCLRCHKSGSGAGVGSTF